jgi:hypothetical protein
MVLPQFAARCLFSRTSHITLAVTSGNRHRFFFKMPANFKLKEHPSPWSPISNIFRLPDPHTFSFKVLSSEKRGESKQAVINQTVST